MLALLLASSVGMPRIAQAREAERDSEPIDLAASWEAGDARLSAAGDYTLSADVSSSEPLVVELPAGKKATVDLAGHSVMVGGDVSCAIDLSRNKGEVVILDSKYDEAVAAAAGDAVPAPSASVKLKADGAQDAVATVKAVRDSSTKDASPSAEFKGFRIEVEASSKTVEAYEKDAFAIEQGIAPGGDDAKWNEDEQEATLVLEDCVVSASVSADESVRDQAQHSGVARGAVRAIESGSRGVRLQGRFAASATIDGEDVAEAGAAVFGSRVERSYTLAEDFEPLSVKGDSRRGTWRDAQSASFTFGFPGKSFEGDQNRAVVAVAEKGKTITAKAAERLAVEEGYDAEFLQASDDGSSCEGLAIVRRVQEQDVVPDDQPGEAEASEEVAGDALDSVAEQAEQVEQDSGSSDDASRATTIQSHDYAEYLAEHADAAVYGWQIRPAATGMDLNAAWTKTEEDFSITQGGTYYLSADLTANGRIDINASGQDVVIELRGHTMTLDGSGAEVKRSLIAVDAARSVIIDGGLSTASSSRIVSAGNSVVYGVSSTATGCALVLRDLSIKLSSNSSREGYLHTHCVHVTAGTLAMERVTATMDMGNQEIQSGNFTMNEASSTVYASDGVSSVRLADCTVTGIGSPAFEASDFSEAVGLGVVYSLYSEATATTVSGGNYTAESLRGNATCLYGKNLAIGAGASQPQLTAGAGNVATGVLSTVAGGVKLNTPVTFSIADNYAGLANVEAALRSSVSSQPGGFVFGDCASSASQYGVLVASVKSLDVSNSSGYCIGSFEESLAASARNDVAAALVDARKGGSSFVTQDGDNVLFQFDVANAAARIGLVEYPTVAKGIAAMTSGDTLVLLKDADAVSLSSVTNGTIDLNTHEIASLEVSGGAAGGNITVKNGSVKGALKMSGSLVSIWHHSSSNLSLEGVSVQTSGIDKNTYGIYASRGAGTISLDSTSSVLATLAQASVTGCAVYGISVEAKGPAVSLTGAMVAARTESPSTSAYGLCTATSANLSNAKVSANGSNSSTYAVNVGGTFVASGSTFEVQTSDVASSAAGLNLNSYPTAESVDLSGCAISVQSRASSSAVAGADYACVRSFEATSDEAPSLTLSGSTKLDVAGGYHLGPYLGHVTLGSGFELMSATLGGASSSVIVSQLEQSGDVGFTVSGVSATSALAARFSAAAGSHYGGWKLVIDGNDLVWRPNGSSGNVELVHAGSATNYATASAAFEAAAAGDTVKLLDDVTESRAITVTASGSANDVMLDLNGNDLTLRAGSAAVAGSGGAGGALVHASSGTFTVDDSAGGGSLALEVGAKAEYLSYTYQGISVCGGGKLEIGDNASVSVSYTGSSKSSSPQNSGTAVRGISLTSGSVKLEGSLKVSGALADGSRGAMNCIGVFAQPGSGATADVDVTSSASVDVTCPTGEKTTKNPCYPETMSSNTAPVGLREIKVDPATDADFYNDIVSQFLISAKYDDPETTGTSRSTFGARIYYAPAMILRHEGKWYDGMPIWAFSNEVTATNVGSSSAILPTHFFVSTQLDELPNAYGVATGASSAGTANVSVSGSVAAASPHGNAHALDARSGTGGSVTWRADGSSLKATGDSKVHLVAQKNIDLRDYISFRLTTQSTTVAYSGMGSAKAVEFTPGMARNVAKDDAVSFTLAGRTSFTAEASNAAAVEAKSFDVSDDFSLASSSQLCSVANNEGSNTKGVVFAVGARDASLFEDAYAVYEPQAVANGVAWGSAASYTVTFKVGSLTVASYDSPTSIDLSEPSARAGRVDDQRWSYTLIGWSLKNDENATSGYESATGTISPRSSATYYAVYATGPITNVDVSFTNVHDSSGTTLSTLKISATYGQTLGVALSSNGKTLPTPADYVDTSGVHYRFAGWCAYSSASTTARLITQSSLPDTEVTLSLTGLSSTGSLEMRAVYQAVQPSQHVITFIADGYESSCVVDEGTHPTYAMANSVSSSYVNPQKVVGEVGKVFSFKNWYVDVNGNGQADSGEMSYATVLPAATADATYTASWNSRAANMKLTFHFTHLDSETGDLKTDGSATIQKTYGSKTVQEYADSIQPVGTKISYNGNVYTLKGWSPRSGDKTPVYDASNPIPELGSGSQSVSVGAELYSGEYYGVYEASDHKVQVTFIDEGKVLGSASVSSSKSIDYAYSLVKDTEPADKSASLQFLGWATKANAESELDGISTTIESIVGPDVYELTLYSVYGEARVYSVHLRSTGGEKLLGDISVKSGKSVNRTLKNAKKTLAIPSKSGYYFWGWTTAAGDRFSLDDPVTGSMDLYATYKKVRVKSDDSTLAGSVTTTLSDLEGATSVTLYLEKAANACSAVSTTIINDKYITIFDFSMKLVAVYPSGTKHVITGDVGTIDLSFDLGTAYKNATLRAFWMGVEKGNDTVKVSAAKKIDAKGKISVSIGNYSMGDETEGGNLSVAYLGSGSSASGLGTIGLGDSGLSGLSGLSALSGASADASSVLGSGLVDATASATAAAGASTTGGSDGVNADGSTAGDEAGSEGDQSITGSISGDAWTLIIIAVIAVAILIYGLWRLLIVGQRRREEEEELPEVLGRYAEGIRF